MKKTARKLTALLAAAVTAVSVMTAASSALTLCIGGRCYEISLPSRCTRVIQLTHAERTDTQTAPAPDCVGISCATPSPAVPTGGEEALSSEVTDVLALVNGERAAAGLSALTLDSKLCALADIRAKEIVQSFSHTRPNGTSCFTVFGENGVSYRYAGENLAYGQTSAKAVMNAWMNSSGHRANILGKNFGKIGISCYIANGRKYWVQLFMN